MSCGSFNAGINVFIIIYGHHHHHYNTKPIISLYCYKSHRAGQPGVRPLGAAREGKSRFMVPLSALTQQGKLSPRETLQPLPRWSFCPGEGASAGEGWGRKHLPVVVPF